jgi:hypothetical protein
METTVPRGRGVDRQIQLRCCRIYQENARLDPDSPSRESVRSLANREGVSKSTVHRYVNQDALNADRRRSRRRRERIKRQGHR